MWTQLPEQQKEQYKRLLLAFASLTEMFAQKADKDEQVAPVMSSKYQETAFRKAFNAVIEDIDNSSFDASLKNGADKYLVGIKTFGIKSGDQKIAQFKANNYKWAPKIDEMVHNAEKEINTESINAINHDLYLEMAKEIAKIRNARIESSYAKLKGFIAKEDDPDIYSVYHVIMPSAKGDAAKLFVGETQYDKIDTDNITIVGCTNKKNPSNFVFEDGKHTYKYTPADSQLYMKFDNRNIVCEEWDVKYADDATLAFEEIAERIYRESDKKINPELEFEYTSMSSPEYEKNISESYCWTIWNKNREVEISSGFNSFYGTGSKRSKKNGGREKAIASFKGKYDEVIPDKVLEEVEIGLYEYLLSTDNEVKRNKSFIRETLVEYAKGTENEDLINDLNKLVFRPVNEIYIPIPNSVQFHEEHPNFFGKGFGQFVQGTKKLALNKEDRAFNLVFEPSGDSLRAYIAQDGGKAIESVEKQSYLGEWILRGVFQLEAYEPLTTERLEEMHINGIRLYKYEGSDDVHLEFIWIDENHPPKDYIEKNR
ncbi:MAG: hypothetical protein MJ146_03680 [Clostridia bacterium]|nr:hypothetical protein [Clostridia bacterium]